MDPNKWTKSVNKEFIEMNIEWCNDILFVRTHCLKYWESIRIKPEKWLEQSTIGKDLGGFWVVAILGNKVVFYDDIEEGFGISYYSRYGEIDTYSAGGMELHELIESMYEGIFLR